MPGTRSRSRFAVSVLTRDCSVPDCDGSTPRWSVLCDLHRGRLADGVRLTDGDPMTVPKKRRKSPNDIVFRRPRGKAPAAPSDDDRLARELE